MCGIVGVLNLMDERPVEENMLRRMLGMIRHRGPDQFGILLDGPLGLGSARLSIIDLATGQQPIGNEDGALWIVCNGEMFNYVEARRELAARGHRFATASDTEVILHLYEEHGPACLQQINGQFALAIWDRRARTLFLARDRLGIRPLYYTLCDGALLFGSEIKALLADPRVPAAIDPVALDQVLTFWCPLAPRTAFRGIVALPPGHSLLLEPLAGQGEVPAPQRYWKLDFEAGRRGKAECAAELYELLVDATRVRLRADVPVAAYLSGGLDSSTVSALIRRYTGRHLETFAVTFDDPAFDESAFQQQVSRWLGTKHHVVRCTAAKVGRALPDAIWHAEVPITRTAPVPLFLLSRLVNRAGFKVVMTGEGADEFLGGYNIYKEALVRRFWARNPGSEWRPLLLHRLYPYIGQLGRTRDYLHAFFGQGLEDVDAPDYSHAIRWRNTRRARRFFSAELRAELGQRPDQPVDEVSLPDSFAQWDLLARAQYLEATIFLPGYLLSSQGDRVMAAHAVEGRMPFLDHRLVDFAARLPPQLKVRGLVEKYLLKEVARELLPEEIWRRTKRPYRAPIWSSLFPAREPLDYVAELLSPQRVAAYGYFHPAAVRGLVTKIEQGRAISESDDMALAGILTTQLVHQLFVGDFQPRPPLAAHDDVKIVRPGLIGGIDQPKEAR
ncbi:MAG: asparagine synthase (glutamine-hydrolyzing) [Anaerolineae bacterium]|nr:asparagine synthase (glutamine-hydrolyzing) [Anaerolineae bacterium]